MGRHPAGRRPRRAAHGRRPARSRGSRSARRRGRPTVRCGSAATAPGSGACTAGRRRPGPRRWSTWGGTSGSRRGCSGESCFAFLDGGRVAFTSRRGRRRPARLSACADGRRRTARPAVHASIAGLRAAGSRLAFVGATPTTEAHVVTVDVDGRRAGAPIAVVPPRELDVDAAWFSVPEAIDFPTAGGAVAHAFYYPPRHPDVRGPDDERPPLLVFIHGGPTSAARVMLRLAYQYWTTRGFAVVDVNYRGLDRLRARLPRPAARAMGRRRRRGLRGGVPVPRRARRRRPRPAVHPGRVGRRVHDARRAGLRRTSSRPAPATTASPTSAPSLATRTSSRAATSTASSARGPRPGTCTRHGRRSSTSTTIDRPLGGVPGPRGRGRAAEPGRR